MTGGRVKLNARISPPEALSTWTTAAILRCEGENCPCTRYSAHPPVLMMFDPETGEYQQERLRCVAVWAAGSPAGKQGQLCGQQATHQIADVVVCEHHYRRIREWMNDRDERDVRTTAATANAIYQERARVGRLQAMEQARLNAEAARQEAEHAREAARLQAALAREVEKERIRAEEAARHEVSVVYFIRRESDGLIKIGTSRTLAKRLVSLKKVHGPLRLIATTGGDHRQETAFHRQFRAIRVEGEWFRPELPLLDCVYALMKERPLEAAPGLPSIVTRKEIGRMIWKIRYGPLREMRQREAELKEEVSEKRRLARERRKAAAADPPVSDAA